MTDFPIELHQSFLHSLKSLQISEQKRFAGLKLFILPENVQHGACGERAGWRK